MMATIHNIAMFRKRISIWMSSAWCSMDSYGASSSTLSVLSTYMPGVQSCLDKHEWFKHGSCSTKQPTTTGAMPAA
jgi:ribonuclease I